MPPDIQAGIFDLDVLRAEDRAHRLDQHQADAPGGEQRFQRSAVEPADHRRVRAIMPTSAATMNATGTASGRYQSNAPGRYAEQVLHDVGGVGADHDQFAVRHVDDAHQAVGDGEAQRRQQQDRAEAHAAEHADRCVRPRRGATRPRAGSAPGWRIGVGLDETAVGLLLQQRRAAASWSQRHRIRPAS